MNSYDWSLLRLLVMVPCKACFYPSDIQQWLFEQYLERASSKQLEKKMKEMGYDISHDSLNKHRRHLALIAAWTHPIEQIRNKVEEELFRSRLINSQKQGIGEAIAAALEVLRRYLPEHKFEKIIAILESDDS